MRWITTLLLLIFLLTPTSTSYGNTMVYGNTIPKENNNVVYGRLAILIILDALNYTVFEELLDAGQLQNFHKLINLGTLVLGKTIVPSATTAAWAALFTGAPPEINGVVNTYAINSTYYHLLPPDVEPETVGYSDMIKGESLAEVLNEENVKLGFIYSESKVSVALGREGKASLSVYYPEPFDPYDPSLPIIFRESYLDDLINRSINIIDVFSRSIIDGERALVVIDLPEPDASGHTHGPMSSYYKDILGIIDSKIGNLIDYLNESGLWERTLIVVATDHSMIQTVPEYQVLTSDDKHIVGLPVEHRVVPIGTLAYIYLKHEEDLDVAVDYLAKIDWIEGIWTRRPIEGANGTLADIGLNITYAGDIVISLRAPYYIYKYTSKGAHGGVNTRTIPIIFSGGMYDSNYSIPSNVSLLDICPTLAGFLGVRAPKDSVGRDLGVYKNFADIKVGVNPAIANPHQSIEINVSYSMSRYEPTILTISVVDTKTNKTIISQNIEIETAAGTKRTNIIIEKEGEYLVEAIISSKDTPLGRGETKILVVEKAEAETPPEVYYALAISIGIGVVILATPFLIKKLLRGYRHARLEKNA